MPQKCKQYFNALRKPIRISYSEMCGFADELKRKIEAADHIQNVEDNSEWKQNRERLKKLIIEENVCDFLRWDVVRKTMAMPFTTYSLKELLYLRTLSDWKTKWKVAIHESVVGNPIPCVFYPKSSCTLIHHAYHVARFLSTTDINLLTDVNVIVEFGGGYGSMCRLFRELGYKGRYIIYDLPEFCGLQEYFLRSNGILISDPQLFSDIEDATACVSDFEILQRYLKSLSESRRMLIATWSLSESPAAIRNSIFDQTACFEYGLIAFQRSFGGVNNDEYFSQWRKRTTGTQWHVVDIKHLPGHRYMFGNSKYLS